MDSVSWHVQKTKNSHLYLNSSAYLTNRDNFVRKFFNLNITQEDFEILLSQYLNSISRGCGFYFNSGLLNSRGVENLIINKQPLATFLQIQKDNPYAVFSEIPEFINILRIPINTVKYILRKINSSCIVNNTFMKLQSANSLSKICSESLCRLGVTKHVLLLNSFFLD